jgi:lysozyme family protein
MGTVDTVRIEAALAEPWVGLQRALQTNPAGIAPALERLVDACRTVEGLTPQQREALANMLESEVQRLAGRAASDGEEGYESLVGLVNLLTDRAALKKLILVVAAGAAVITTSGSAQAQTTAGGFSPAAIAMDPGVMIAAEMLANAPGLPSHKEDLFERVMEFTEKWEGGKVDDPVDRGGRTNMGVTQKTLDGWRASKGLTGEFDVYEITREEAREIYEANYWDAIGGDDLPERVALAIFDIAVNSGPKKAIRVLQESVGVTADGKLGSRTLAAVYATDPHELFTTINGTRAAWYEAIIANDATQEKYRKGWFNRLNDLRLVGAAGGYESTLDDWRARLGDRPSANEPWRTLTEEDFRGIGS